MIEMTVQIEGINNLRQAFARRPEVVKRYINRAIEASIFEIEKNAVDSNFQFKTPRQFRTGLLQRSFKLGIVTRDFFGAIGPTVAYAKKVHDNNPFMERIALASQPQVQRHFDTAMQYIAEDLSK